MDAFHHLLHVQPVTRVRVFRIRTNETGNRTGLQQTSNEISPHPNSRAGFNLLPRMILFPDFPVFKWEKKSIRDVSVNNGLHYTGIALTPPFSRFRSTLDVHFIQHQQDYLSDKLARIHAKALLWDPRHVTEYAFKSVKRGRVSQEHIIILPRTIGEMTRKTSFLSQRSRIN